mgnify:CR=1 FL=1
MINCQSQEKFLPSAGRDSRTLCSSPTRQPRVLPLAEPRKLLVKVEEKQASVIVGPTYLGCGVDQIRNHARRRFLLFIYLYNINQ